jgi:hypothetical protein
MKIKNIIKSAVKAKVTAAKAKAKAKVAAKIAAKAKCKGGKCRPCTDGDCSGGKCKPCAIALALVLAATLCGCGTTTPSRSQTLTLRDCTVNIYGSGDGTTNDVARVEIASQAMSIENSGTETQTATPQYTTDVKPDIDLNYNDPAKAAADSAGGVAESAVDLIKSATAE